jgi:AcrR family transcriptional regulator
MPYTPEHRQAMRERILASARRLFNRSGLSEVTIDDVMAGVGLTRGGFYNYFNSKEELYAEAITLFTRRFPAESWQCSELGPQPEGADLPRMIVNAYLSRAHLDDIEGSCPLMYPKTHAVPRKPRVPDRPSSPDMAACHRGGRWRRSLLGVTAS